VQHSLMLRGLIRAAWAEPQVMSALRARALSTRLSIQADAPSEEAVGDYTPVRLRLPRPGLPAAPHCGSMDPPVPTRRADLLRLSTA